MASGFENERPMREPQQPRAAMGYSHYAKVDD